MMVMIDRFGRRPLLLIGSAAMFVWMVFAAVITIQIEIFPMDVKEKALSTSVGSQWLANFVIAYVVPQQVEYMKIYGTLLFYSFCLAITYAIIFCFVPETKGRAMEDMDELFGA